MSFLSIDGTLVVQLLNFAVFFALLSVVFLKPVASAIAKRRQYIDSLVTDYDRYQAEAHALRAQAEEVRAAARLHAEQQVTAARATASNDAAQLSSDFNERAQRIVDEAQRTAQAELDAARSGEGQAVADLAK